MIRERQINIINVNKLVVSKVHVAAPGPEITKSLDSIADWAASEVLAMLSCFRKTQTQHSSTSLPSRAV